MPTLRQYLTSVAAQAFEDCGYSPELGVVTSSDREDLCQYQCNGALSAAKIYRKNPMMIAGEVAERLSENRIFKSVKTAPPGFINIIMDDGFLSECAAKMLEDERLSLPLADTPKTIVIDYGGPNVAKPLHIGHLRTAIIGEALKRLARFLGHNVIGDVHLGDWGLQMGLIIAELYERQPELVYFDEDYTGEYPDTPPVSIDDLNRLYPEASARSKSDEEFLRVAQKATNELQNGRAGYVALWRHFLSVSISDLKKSYLMLNVEFDKWLGESDANEYVPELMQILKNKGISYLSDGALVVDVALPEDEEPIPPIIISKSDGSQLYATTDLATILQRVSDFDPDEMWYVVDNRQSMHFKQVFRAARRAELVDESVKLYHVGFGTMNGSDGKPFKTRDGGVMRLSDLIETATTAARSKINESETAAAMEDSERELIAGQVGIAALKFGDLINHRTKDYVFDMDRFLSAEGKTGPYLQYTVVRIKSVMKKAAEANAECGELLPPENDVERALIIKLLSVGDVLLRAFEEKAPNVICEMLFDIAGLFNRFYFENKIISNPDNARRASWLSLLTLISRTITLLLEILATDVPERM